MQVGAHGFLAAGARCNPQLGLWSEAMCAGDLLGRAWQETRRWAQHWGPVDSCETDDCNGQALIAQLELLLQDAQAQQLQLLAAVASMEAERQFSQGLVASLQVEEQKANELASMLEAERTRAEALASELHQRDEQAAQTMTPATPVKRAGRMDTAKVPALTMPQVKASPRRDWLPGVPLNRATAASTVTGVNMVGGLQFPPAMPAPPVEHYLMTPRTGFTPRTPQTPALACKTGEGYLEATPSIPSSRSSSPTGSCASKPSSWESVEHWDRLASPESAQPMEPESARSDYTLCAMYGTGAEAEVKVLQSVIRDLELELRGSGAKPSAES